MLSLKSILPLVALLVPALADLTIIAFSKTDCQERVGFTNVLSVNSTVGIDEELASFAVVSAGDFETNNPKCSFRYYKSGHEDNYVSLSPIRLTNGLCIVPKGGKTVPRYGIVGELVCPTYS